MEEPDRLGNFIPGGQHGEDAEEEREHQKQEAQAVEREMKPDTKLRDPSPIGLLEPGMEARLEIADPQRQGEDEINQHSDQRDPTSG